MVLNSAPVILSLLCLGSGNMVPDASDAHRSSFLSSTSSSLRDILHDDFAEVGQAKLAEIERGLAPMYAALPKNSAGRLGHAAAAYALRRHLLKTYGWLVKGLAPQAGGSSWDWKSSSPTRVLEGKVPDRLRKVLDDSLEGQGLDLESLTITAAVLELVLEEDSGLYLEEAFRLTEVPVDGMATEEEMEKALEAFMLIYITTGGKKIVGGSPTRFRKFLARCENKSAAFNPLWQETKVWVHDIELSAEFAHRSTNNPFLGGALSFSFAEHLVEDLHSQYRRIQSTDCVSLKHKLLSMEDTRGTGRLSFTQFQNSSKHGATWEFKESQEELTALGALDVSDPSWPRVIIANYVQSPANCLAQHHLHSVCCIDECEALLAEVEREVGAPAGDPTVIARTVSRLESETMDSPRNVSAKLLGRLQDMAARHSGLVPLHGRLFAQWMHFAFPNECAYPLPSRWNPPEHLVRKGLAEPSPKDILHALDQNTTESRQELAEELMPWSDEDELIEGGLGQGSYLAWSLRGVLLFAFLSMAVGTLRSGLLALRRKDGGKDHKHNI